MNKRQRARNRWHLCKLGLGWLRLARNEPGDWYWTDGAQYAELRRRGFIDGVGRVTTRGYQWLYDDAAGQ